MSKKKTAMPKITLIVLLSISAVLLILLGIWLVGELKDSFSDPTDGTEPGAISTSVSGGDEVVMLVNSYIADMRKDKTLTIEADGVSVKLDLNEAGAPVDYDELESYMKSKGYDTALIGQYKTVLEAQGEPGSVYNDEYITKKIDELAVNVDTGSDTEYELIEGGVTFYRGSERTVFDKAALADSVKAALDAHRYDTIIVSTTKEAPEIPDLDELYTMIYCEPADAYYDVDENKNTIVVDHVVGYDIDIELIRKELTEGTWTEKTFMKQEILPEVTAETLPQKYFKDLLGQQITYYNPAEKNRTVNVGLATAAVNENIILPGQTFSFNRVVGERTAQKGYLPATVFQNGGMQEGLGGGICQVTSTIYAAALKAELDQVSRYVHAYKVSYVDLGMDATVYWGSLDYVFRNNTQEPIKIVSSAKNGTLTISIYGKETRPANRTIKFRSVVLETYMQEMKFEEDLTLAPGAEKKIRSGMPGYKVELYKQIYVDGVLQNEVKINTSKYSAYNGLTKVGPKPVVTDPPVTEPPVTEPPVTTPPETDSPVASGTTGEDVPVVETTSAPDPNSPGI